MADVLAFTPKERDDPHSAGKAHCTACKHEWVGVVPVGTVWLTCPGCGAQKGLLTYPCERDGLHWTCVCGNQLFNVMREGLYCPNFGDWQQGF